MERCPMRTDLFALHVLLAMLELRVVVPYAPRLSVGKVGCSHDYKKVVVSPVCYLEHVQGITYTVVVS